MIGQTTVNNDTLSQTMVNHDIPWQNQNQNDLFDHNKYTVVYHGSY